MSIKSNQIKLSERRTTAAVKTARGKDLHSATTTEPVARIASKTRPTSRPPRIPSSNRLALFGGVAVAVGAVLIVILWPKNQRTITEPPEKQQIAATQTRPSEAMRGKPDESVKKDAAEKTGGSNAPVSVTSSIPAVTPPPVPPLQERVIESRAVGPPIGRRPRES